MPVSEIRPSSRQYDTIGDRQRLVDVLLDDQHRRALGLDDRHRLVHLATTIGAKPERDLVEQQQSRVGHQRSADRQRLLLATRTARRPIA